MSEDKGFWDPEEVMGDRGIIPLKLALIASEVSEALAAHREEYDDTDEHPDTGMSDQQTDDFLDEIADIMIRCLDLTGRYNLPIGEAIKLKMEKNSTRPYRHGKRY